MEEDALRDDFIDALQDPSHLSMSRENAVNSANQLLDVAEGELGILVRVGPNQVGFIHRVMQEHLAAEYVANRLEFEDVKDLFKRICRETQLGKRYSSSPFGKSPAPPN